MKSVADDLRRARLAEQSSMTAAERIELSRRLGADAAAAYAGVHGITIEQAHRALQRQRQVGRRYSACHAALLS